MPVVKGICEYDGTNYSGWQRQNNSNSIQEEIEKALSTILRKKISIVGSGRTDAGVHALNQVFHFYLEEELDLKSLKKSLNGLLDSDISIKSLEFESEQFHARYSAKKRTYLYIISTRKNVFFDSYSWTIFSQLDKSALREIQNSFLGSHNFSSFCKGEDEVENKICTVFYSRWFSKNDFLLYFISADRFIHGMVRGIVGLSVEYARGKISKEEVNEILDGKRRCPLWAPSKGLILYKVDY
ncbi:MAG: tRNA pseudouridine(38-40) synthase TruA [Ignavibacteria bacterium]|nr:tRNA pseudouridine(38-40) synthase TruA [Ignavibacteria bacterium]